MPTIEFENVSKIYGEDTVALDDVSFTISEGEFVILLGPSGAGKSTMLRVLNGLTDPTEGTVRIGGVEISGNRSEVGMVFQEHYLIESKTAFGNALTGALSRNGLLRSMLGLHSEYDKINALESLQTVGLLDEAGQRAESMSGGQKQRVGIARALVQEPEIVLADEPVASLDPKAAREVMRYLKKAATEKDLTTVTSLHQVNIAREFGDRFLGIRDGEVIFDGDADDLTMEEMDRIYYGHSGDGDSLSTDPTGTDAVPSETPDPNATPDGGESV
ncbi:phosphonate ABC transporter ATP-binding protein [Halobellus clavatus]|jgi:phosphonate transport system ATP-binding protein|uniref:Phosphonate transport system ATP-binding protein n=1 Tax=Halobellus clavatus TaxID=660517 RepID=A0A1H3DQU9_9EURY|nr:phosphonate ABC transporter ATP-binding protein [Halobellus clavatus]SDX68039.1 phosphonate transport system ATP-binding protein [Halobellus clavatus]